MAPAAPCPVTHLAAYQFGRLENLRPLREHLKSHSLTLGLKGTILLSHEGINLFVAGTHESILALLKLIRELNGFESFDGKYNPCDRQPYNRMLVRLKREIISMGVDEIQPASHTSPKLKPKELKKWLDEGRPITLLDTRNRYEIQLGTFRNALTLGIDKFRDFPDAIKTLPNELKHQPIVMFCTGGIRCEKAGPLMEREGFENIHQLEGGILKYFEECADAHYDGECFVFDQRTGVDPSLHESDSAHCYRCQSPLTPAEQADPRFVSGQSCPHCFVSPEAARQATLFAHQKRLHEAANPLPGSVPYDNFRPVTVPARCDGMMLLPFLTSTLPHTSAERWQELWEQRCLVDDQHQPIPLDRPLRAGERCLQRQPAAVEPDVNAHVTLLHEDEAIIVLNKPAPLPMHPGGRFNRNTLKHLVHTAYHPLRPRPAHRLDANTSGVVVFAKTRHHAGRLQPEFAAGRVAKIYVARVSGHVPEDVFACDAPISDEAGPFGNRSTGGNEGRSARTEFEVCRRLPDGSTLLIARPLTGRTNQIRIHLSLLGHPIVGDPVYAAAGKQVLCQTLPTGAPPMCLHARSLSFHHPLNQEWTTFHAPLPRWALEAST